MARVRGRPYRPAVRTLPFHGGNRGSNPRRVAIPDSSEADDRNQLKTKLRAVRRLSGQNTFHCLTQATNVSPRANGWQAGA